MSDQYDKETLDLAQEFIDALNSYGRSAVSLPMDVQEGRANQWGKALGIAVVNSDHIRQLMFRLEKLGVRPAILGALQFGFCAGLRAGRHQRGSMS